MTHDPLCEFNFVLREVGDCQRCDLIARVRMDQDNVHADTSDWMRDTAYAKGRADALAEAREAVAALRPDKWEGYAATQAALAAIDALRGES
jgi:hypothetical protein